MIGVRGKDLSQFFCVRKHIFRDGRDRGTRLKI